MATAWSEGMRAAAATLTDVPVPIDSWQRFDALFAWNERAYGYDVVGASYLGVAVRLRPAVNEKHRAKTWPISRFWRRFPAFFVNFGTTSRFSTV